MHQYHPVLPVAAYLICRSVHYRSRHNVAPLWVAPAGVIRDARTLSTDSGPHHPGHWVGPGGGLEGGL
jgi:hypothetical protein